LQPTFIRRGLEVVLHVLLCLSGINNDLCMINSKPDLER